MYNLSRIKPDIIISQYANRSNLLGSKLPVQYMKENRDLIAFPHNIQVFLLYLMRIHLPNKLFNLNVHLQQDSHPQIYSSTNAVWHTTYVQSEIMCDTDIWFFLECIFPLKDLLSKSHLASQCAFLNCFHTELPRWNSMSTCHIRESTKGNNIKVPFQ